MTKIEALTMAMDELWVKAHLISVPENDRENFIEAVDVLATMIEEMQESLALTSVEG